MPLVLVRYNPVGLGLIADPTTDGLWWSDSQQRVRAFTAQLPEIVAAALHVEETPEGHLTVGDVEVHVTQSQNGDVSDYALDLTVFANEYEPRLANLDLRRREIGRGVMTALRANFPRATAAKVCVWVLLCPGSFEDFVVN